MKIISVNLCNLFWFFLDWFMSTHHMYKSQKNVYTNEIIYFCIYYILYHNWLIIESCFYKAFLGFYIKSLRCSLIRFLYFFSCLGQILIQISLSIPLFHPHDWYVHNLYVYNFLLINLYRLCVVVVCNIIHKIRICVFWLNISYKLLVVVINLKLLLW